MKTLAKKLQAFVLGAWEFRLNFTTHFADNGMQYAYDWGRELAHRLTLRRFEQ
jgi:hypothetical protein